VDFCVHFLQNYINGVFLDLIHYYFLNIGTYMKKQILLAALLFFAPNIHAEPGSLEELCTYMRCVSGAVGLVGATCANSPLALAAGVVAFSPEISKALGLRASSKVLYYDKSGAQVPHVYLKLAENDYGHAG
jgi:hypothetical protein